LTRNSYRWQLRGAVILDDLTPMNQNTNVLWRFHCDSKLLQRPDALALVYLLHCMVTLVNVIHVLTAINRLDVVLPTVSIL
jgi:hypothetical protein